MEEVKIEVTAEDIGKPGKWTRATNNIVGPRCMVDRALDRAFGEGAFHTVANEAFGAVGSQYRGKKIPFPTKVRNAIERWDNKQRVEPFTFTAKIEEV